MTDFSTLRNDPPDKYNWQDITEFDTVDKRAFMMEELCGSQIGILGSDLKWQPASMPPSDEDLLGWIWVIRPDLESDVLAEASETLASVIAAFRKRIGTG